MDRAVKLGDLGKVDKAELTLLNKKYHALIVRAKLKRISAEVTNMAVEWCAKF